jgi:hypothetical protein
MKWYYIAIPAAVVILYLLFSSKSTILKNQASSSGLGGTLAGVGAASTGLAGLYDKIVSSIKCTSSSGEE